MMLLDLYEYHKKAERNIPSVAVVIIEEEETTMKQVFE
jgi:hypothetical protein